MPLAIIIAQLLAQYGPELAGKIAVMLHSKSEPTLEDWHRLLAGVASKSYDDYMSAIK